MQQADTAGSTRPGAASPGNCVRHSTSRRAILGAALAVPVAAATKLTQSSWQERFDPATWIDRWYKAGHALYLDNDGWPRVAINMDRDERYAAAMRGELGYGGNRERLLQYLSARKPSGPGLYSGLGSRGDVA